EAALTKSAHEYGFVLSAMIWSRLQCRKARGQLSQWDEGQLVYDFTRVLIDEARYGPGQLDVQRGTVLRNATWLRQIGLSSLSSDLEAHFATANSAVRVATPPRLAAEKSSV